MLGRDDGPGEDWRVSNEPSGSDHRQVRFSLVYEEEIRWDRNPKHTNWMSYRADLESILKKTPSSFHTIENLEMVAQFVSDAIKTAYESNCTEKPKYSVQNLLMEQRALGA